MTLTENLKGRQELEQKRKAGSKQEEGQGSPEQWRSGPEKFSVRGPVRKEAQQRGRELIQGAAGRATKKIFLF